MGLPELDRHLPAQGLARGGLHDVSPRAHGDQPAAMGFALALALRRLADPQERRPLLWCRLRRMSANMAGSMATGSSGWAFPATAS